MGLSPGAANLAFLQTTTASVMRQAGFSTCPHAWVMLLPLESCAYWLTISAPEGVRFSVVDTKPYTDSKHFFFTLAFLCLERSEHPGNPSQHACNYIRCIISVTPHQLRRSWSWGKLVFSMPIQLHALQQETRVQCMVVVTLMLTCILFIPLLHLATTNPYYSL